MKPTHYDNPKCSDKHLTGNERFTLNGISTEMTMLSFWQWHFSEIYDLQSKFAEFIVGKALGLTEAQNVGDWTLFDILYQGKRIEIKESAYFHAWQTDQDQKSEKRIFGITKAYDKYQDNSSPFRRQNDIYVFCLNTGKTREESNPLELDHWLFYVIPTGKINTECGNAKSISLSRIQKLTNAVKYQDLKRVIDDTILTLN